MAHAKQSAQTAVKDVIEGWLAATGRKDAAASLAYLAPGVVEYNLAPPLKAPEPNEKGLNRWFRTWEGPIEFTVHELQVECDVAVAFAYGLLRMRGTKANGSTDDMWYRASFGLRKQGGHWRIAHIHDSVPFYMDGSEHAATDLSPDVAVDVMASSPRAKG